MKAKITEDCISCGLCSDMCPDVFEVPTGELAKVKVDEIPEDQSDCAREAADACPTSAIVIEE